MSHRQQLVKVLFSAVVELDSAAEQAEYLAEHCGDDEQLRREVLDLVAHDHQADDFLQPNTACVATVDMPRTDVFPQMIGPYKLREKLGEGGMGVVYVAEQKAPVRRKVALKIIKPGMATKEVSARFEAERQALAMMEHPHIARIIDAGTTDASTTNPGQPYFVMELVMGVPITRYCDEHSLNTRARLQLFVKVCRAVQHAHQKGIIHRDLKPSNVLVAEIDGQPVPKVIDFGVAKAVGANLGQETVYTQVMQMLGTPMYMSPEQAALGVVDVDTRSDCYSLGVLLYELLTGCTPFERDAIQEHGLDEFRRMVREVEPSKPSHRVSTLDNQMGSTISGQRKTDARQLSISLRRELDWIVMRALEKDRARRYESASSFAADIESYLKDESVQACPPSAIYKFRKFARRNKVLLATASLVAAVLVLGVIGTSWQAIRAMAAEQEAIFERDRTREQTDRAISEARISAAINAFLNDDLLAQADPENQPDPNVTLRAVVDRASEKIEGQFADQPAVEAALRHTLAKTYDALGIFDEAQKHAGQAMQLRTEHLGANDANTIQTERLYAGILNRQGNFQAARRQLDALLKRARSALGADDTVTLEVMHCLAEVLNKQGFSGEAERLASQTLEIRRSTLGEEHIHTLQSMDNLGTIYEAQGRTSEAEEMHRRTLEICRRTLGEEHQRTLSSMNNLAIVYSMQERFRESEELKYQVLEVRRRTLGEEHPKTLASIHNLASAYDTQGRYSEAEGLYLQTLEISRRTLGEEHPLTLSVMSNLAIVYLEQGRLGEAEDLNSQVLATRRRVLGDEHPDTLGSINNLGSVRLKQERYDEAEGLYRDVLEISRRTLGGEHPDTLMQANSLATVYIRQNRNSEAEALCIQTLKICRRTLGDDHLQTFRSMRNLADVCQGQKRYDELEELFLVMLEFRRRRLGNEHPSTLSTWNNLATAVWRLGRHAEAEEHFLPMLKIHRRILGNEHPQTLSVMNNLAGVYHAQARFVEAEELHRETLELRRRTLGDEHPKTLSSMVNLSKGIYAQGRYAEAEAVLVEMLEICRLALGDDHPQTILSKQNLAKFSGSLCWKLTTAADAYARDSQKAVRLARYALAIRGRANDWNNLGVALYRHGEYVDAVEALEKADAMIRQESETGDRNHRFFLAMACWQSGSKEEARSYYEEGIASVEETDLEPGHEQLRFRAEAAELMGIALAGENGKALDATAEPGPQPE